MSGFGTARFKAGGSGMNIRAQLFAMQDMAYRDFQCALMPTVPRERVIGVRTPQLRKLARSLAGAPEIPQFLADLPHAYYEEDNLHAFLLEGMRDFDACAQAVDAFLPYVDNWATCDSMNPRVFAREADRLLPWIDRWLSAEQTYAVRFGIVMLMKHFLGERFAASHLERVAAIRSEAYYVNMAAAWFFATALTKQYEATLPYLAGKRLPPWTHNMAIRKARESRAIPADRKAYLTTLSI